MTETEVGLIFRHVHESDTEEQDDGMLDPEILLSLSQQLGDVTVPIHTPPGELVPAASSAGHAGK
eukprot:434918-Prorocentrum_lima.AAC.1